VGRENAGRSSRAGTPTHHADADALGRGVVQRVAIPARIGPVEFGTLGRLIAVRCPHDFDHLMRKAGGQWEPGSRRWLVERWRIGPVIRALEAAADPLFRRAGISLD
jgi:hypothetical protein